MANARRVFTDPAPTRAGALREAARKDGPLYRRAVAPREHFDARRALRRAGLNLRDEAHHTAGIGSEGAGNALEAIGAGNYGGIVNFGLLVLGGIFGLLLLNLLVGNRGSAIAGKSLQWTSGLLGRIVSPTDPLIGAGHSSAPTSSSSPAPTTSSTGSPSAAVTHNHPGDTTGSALPFTIGAPTKRIVPIPGTAYKLDAAYVQATEWIAKTFGVTITSGYRTAAENAAVGGAPNSDHLTGSAVDFGGSTAALNRLYQWASAAGFPYVESPAQAVAAGEGSHVHITFYRP